MTNKEKYKQAFSAIHISDEISLDEKIVKSDSKFHTGRMPKMQAFFSRIVRATFGGMIGRLNKNAGSTIDLSARRSAQMRMMVLFSFTGLIKRWISQISLRTMFATLNL